MEYRAFLLEINLKTPLIITDKLMLDALLYAALEIEAGTGGVMGVVPLKNTAGLYHGSQLFIGDDASKSPVTFTKNCEFDAALYAEKDNKKKYSRVPSIESKIRIDTYESTESQSVYFFGCGDIARVKQLLSLIESIGKRHTDGYGAIDKVLVHLVNQDASLLFEGVSMRPVPEHLWEKITDKPIDPDLRFYEAWQFPYWDKVNRDWCVCGLDNRLSVDRLRYICSS